MISYPEFTIRVFYSHPIGCLVYSHPIGCLATKAFKYVFLDLLAIRVLFSHPIECLCANAFKYISIALKSICWRSGCFSLIQHTP